MIDQSILRQFEVQEAELAQLCANLRVRALYVFGSLARNEFQKGTSDIDFLVEFETTSVEGFFRLREGLQRLFQYEKIDLVTLGSLKNQAIRKQILNSQRKVYAA